MVAPQGDLEEKACLKVGSTLVSFWFSMYLATTEIGKD